MIQKEFLKIDIDKIKKYERNNKKHGENVKEIMKSIQANTYIAPIIIDEEGVILAGHGRYEAMKKIGEKNIDVLQVGGLTTKQKKDYRLRDNKLTELSEWDLENIELELREINDEELNALFPEIDLNALDYDEEKEDEIPEVTEEIIVKRGDIFQLGEHRIMCGDSTSKEDVDKLMDGKKADMVFNDPPYGVSYADKNAYLNAISPGNRIQKEIKNDHMTDSETSEFWIKVFGLLYDNMADKSIYYITGPQGGDLLLLLLQSIQLSGLQLKHMLIRSKNNHVLGRCDYNYKHEPILYGWKDKHEFYGKGKFNTSIREIPKPHKSDLHPTMKPIELIENCLLDGSKQNDICLDLFLGSGSTLIACEKTNRICYGMEIDEHYIQVIIKRYHDYTKGQKEIKCINRILDLQPY